MNEHIKGRLRQHTGKLLIGGTGTLLALSVLTLGSSLVGDSPAASDTRPDALVQRLKSDLDKAQAELRTQHAVLLTQLPGVDVERVDRDTATGRSLLLSLTDSSASTRTVKEQQALLDARYGCLDHESRVLTEFVPEWMTATGAVQGSGTTYTLMRPRYRREPGAGPGLLLHGGGPARSGPRRGGSEQHCQERVRGFHLRHLSGRHGDVAGCLPGFEQDTRRAGRR